MLLYNIVLLVISVLAFAAAVELFTDILDAKLQDDLADHENDRIQ